MRFVEKISQEKLIDLLLIKEYNPLLYFVPQIRFTHNFIPQLQGLIKPCKPLNPLI